jgi:hypothetical protein
MQESLFAEHLFTPIDREFPTNPAKRTRAPQPTEPERTLFGIVETKAQARKRAQEIVRLIEAVEDAPEATRCRSEHIDALAYFIERSKKVALDPNDLDGLLRMVGDMQELLTEAECRAMRNKNIWREYTPGWIGTRPGQMYPAALHPKELRYLRGMQDELRDEMEAIRKGAEGCKSELELLRAVGPLPDNVAQRYSLTPDGHSAKPKKITGVDDAKHGNSNLQDSINLG